jgi:hypothetical protein
MMVEAEKIEYEREKLKEDTLLQKKKIESDAKLQLFTTLIQSDKSPNTTKSYMSVFEEL